MKREWGRWMLAMLAGMMMTHLFLGCRTTDKMITTKHDEILIYNLPFDLTYLKTMDALQKVPGWQLQSTEKERGLITVFNSNYSALNDADQRVITFKIVSLGQGKTSVQIDPEDQRVPDGGDLMKEVAAVLNEVY